MPKQQDAALARKKIDTPLPPDHKSHAHTSPHRSKRAWFWPAFLPLIVVSSILVNWVFLAQNAFAAPATPFSTPGHNTLQQFLQAM